MPQVDNELILVTEFCTSWASATHFCVIRTDNFFFLAEFSLKLAQISSLSIILVFLWNCIHHDSWLRQVISIEFIFVGIHLFLTLFFFHLMHSCHWIETIDACHFFFVMHRRHHTTSHFDVLFSVIRFHLFYFDSFFFLHSSIIFTCRSSNPNHFQFLWCSVVFGQFDAALALQPYWHLQEWYSQEERMNK